jgi:hypothetical protein
LVCHIPVSLLGRICSESHMCTMQYTSVHYCWNLIQKFIIRFAMVNQVDVHLQDLSNRRFS